MVKLDFFKELIQNLLVVYGYIGAAISQVVQDVSKVGAITIYEVSAIFIFADVVTATEHGS